MVLFESHDSDGKTHQTPHLPLIRWSGHSQQHDLRELKAKQNQVPIIRNIRNLGLMIGLELKTHVKDYLGLLLENGVIAMPAGKTVLRLLPPLTISYEELDQAIEIIITTLKSEIKPSNDNTEE